MMKITLSNFPIKFQILFGFLPMLFVLLLLAVNSLNYFSQSEKTVDMLSEIQQETIIFGNIKKDLIALQRNVLVYSYIGYSGVLKKIGFLQSNLEENFNRIDIASKHTKEIAPVFSMMFENYTSYSSHFKRAVREKQKVTQLYQKQLDPTYNELNDLLLTIQKHVEVNKDYKLLYFLEKNHLDVISIKENLYKFDHKPDSKLIIDNRKHFKRLQVYLLDIKNRNSDITLQELITRFLQELDSLEDISKEIIQTSQSYTRLVNIVMAGKSSEIQNLINQLNDLLDKETEILNQEITDETNQSRIFFIGLLITAIIIGIALPFIVANSIATPVSNMATILQNLSKGNIDLTIPAQNRQDEVGEMAKAANAFKITAQDLEHQTAELEEFAYRTSHDLRSPLISSITLLSLIKKSLKRQAYNRVEENVDLVSQTLSQLEKLVRDILDLMKTKNEEEDEKPFNIAIAIDESLHKISHMVHFERLIIQKNIDFDSLIMTKSNRMNLIIENLLSNAVKYQDTQKASSFIKIDCYHKNNRLFLSVEDNGLGIPKQYQDQLFTMFKRFHPKASFGSGLGLYMLQKSAKVLRGEVHYTDISTGSRFTLDIPYVPVKSASSNNVLSHPEM